MNMKKLLLALGAVIILFIGVSIGSSSQKSTVITTQNQTATASRAVDISDRVKETAQLEANPVAPAKTEGLVKVTRVIDGDTIEIEGGEHVRYIGIDTPETVDPRKPV